MEIFETIKGFCIIDESGKRVFAKYYNNADCASMKEQLKFEKLLQERNQKSLKLNDEVIDNFVDSSGKGWTVVGIRAIDLYMYMVGGPFENELMLMSLLKSIVDSLSQIPATGQMLDKLQLLQNFSKALVIFDEAISDGGVILESDKNMLLSRTLSDRPMVNTEDEIVNEIGNKTFNLLKSMF